MHIYKLELIISWHKPKSSYILKTSYIIPTFIFDRSKPVHRLGSKHPKNTVKANPQTMGTKPQRYHKCTTKFDRLKYSFTPNVDNNILINPETNNDFLWCITPFSFQVNT